MTTKQFQTDKRYSAVLGWYDSAQHGVRVFHTNNEGRLFQFAEKFEQAGKKLGGEWEVIAFDHGEDASPEPKLFENDGINTHLLFESEVIYNSDFTEVQQ